MTIYLYSGTPGSGKSLHAANDIRFALTRRTPRPVVANFPIDLGSVKAPWMFTYRPNWELEPDWLMAYADGFWSTMGREFREDYITLVLDECQLLFNSRNWQEKTRMRWLTFFSQHRKYGYRVLFVAQAAKMVDNQFRMCIEEECNHRKVSQMGTVGWLLSLPFRGNLFVRVYKMFQTGDRTTTEWCRAHRADMALYDSRARFQAAT